ncbi:flavodoxin reductase [bacterium]|nr:flavodoxin reductase [candidate division CSSED10-310 bacterium]
MEQHIVKLLSIEKVTHDTRRYVVEKPAGYHFKPGQATEVALNLDGWRGEKRPFTFTSLPSDAHLEFIIKSYQDHYGVTYQLGRLEPGAELILHDVWGAVTYDGPGTFIAGGAGVTPFIAIFRDLAARGKIAGNRLIFSNKTEADIILRDELSRLMGNSAEFIVTRDRESPHYGARLDFDGLERRIDDATQQYYVCGPKQMVKDILAHLQDLGIKSERLVFER